MTKAEKGDRSFSCSRPSSLNLQRRLPSPSTCRSYHATRHRERRGVRGAGPPARTCARSMRRTIRCSHPFFGGNNVDETGGNLALQQPLNAIPRTDRHIIYTTRAHALRTRTRTSPSAVIQSRFSQGVLQRAQGHSSSPFFWVRCRIFWCRFSPCFSSPSHSC